MEPEKGSYEGDRRKTDLEQAQMMARSLKRSSEPRAVDINNMHLGMRGLDEADSLQRQGSLHESLKLYGLSIELLLKCLRFPSPDVSKETLSQRISSGLEEAERVKAKLKASSLSPAQSTSQSFHEGGTSSSLTSYLSSALTTAINCSQTYTSNAPITKAPPSNQSAPATKSATYNVQLKRSNLDYANDPLVQQVKNDLYIDPSELQHTTWNDIAGCLDQERGHFIDGIAIGNR